MIDARQIPVPWRSTFRVRETLPPSRWIERERIALSKRESPGNPGVYSFALTPYLRWVLDLYADRSVNEVWGMKSSQVGVTLGLLLLLAYVAKAAPVNTLYSIDSRDEAKRISRSRLQPMLLNVLGSKGKEEEDAPPAGKDQFSVLTIYLPEMTVFLSGGHSQGALANKAIGFAIVDEVDEHPVPPEGEAHSVDLVRDRLKTVDFGKAFFVGKPKLKSGTMFREHAQGSCHRYFVPCPHCGKSQTLEWSQVKFDHCKAASGEWMKDRVAVETYYQCSHCKRPIDETAKGKMVGAGEWRQTNNEAIPGRISFHISDLYSPFARWGTLANEFIEAANSGSLVKLQRFFNSRLGEAWEPHQSEVKTADVLKLVGDYCMTDDRGPGWVPVDPAMIVLGCDVQGDVYKWVRTAFAPTGEAWVIDYGYTLAADELIEVFDSPITCRPPGCEETTRTCDGALIDEGFKTLEIRDFVLRSGGRFWASKGRAGIQVKKTVAESVTEHRGAQMLVYHFDDDAFKRDMYLARIQRFDKIASGEVKISRIWLPRNVRRDLLDELCGEKLIERKNKRGYTEWQWVRTAANDFGDALKLCMVAWAIRGHEFDGALTGGAAQDASHAESPA